MGIEDRDYYREHHANKQGMRYDPRTATYTRRRPFARTSKVVDVQDLREPPRIVGADWHWSLKLLLWLVIVTLVLVVVRFVSAMMR